MQPLLAALQLLLLSMKVVEPCRLYEGAVWGLLSDWGALQITLGRHLAQWHQPSRGGALQPLALLECTLHKAHLCGCWCPGGIMLCVVALVAHHDVLTLMALVRIKGPACEVPMVVVVVKELHPTYDSLPIPGLSLLGSVRTDFEPQVLF